MTLIDISPVLSPSTAVFPGDVSFERTVVMDVERGDHLTLSSVRSTVHIGAHVDAPNHYARGGRGIDEQPLDLYVGPAEVIHIPAAGRRLGPEDISGEISAARVLFRTDSFPDPNHWNDDFASLSPELVHWLSERGVKLVGIDTPSVDPSTSKGLESHAAIAERDMAILEGIVLGHVEPGLYRLYALPLRIQGADASPVRAVLEQDGSPGRAPRIG
ncbi:MAG: cyclase family protein [Myxococcota bacterium]